MPTVTLSLRSQRAKPVPDRVQFLEVRGRFSGPVQPGEIDLRPSEIVLDLVPDLYTIDVEVGGFAAARGQLQVGTQALARIFPLQHLATRVPRVSQLGPEQRRLLRTLDDRKMPRQVWDALTDNQAATFFQVTYALADVELSDGHPLSSAIDRIVRVGGSELTAPDTSGTLRTVIGWRMHVGLVGGLGIDTTLADAGFKREPGPAHPTHTRFGFVRSFRERKGNPRLQIVTNDAGTGADVDLDTGVFHKSSPHDVYKAFAKRFPDATEIYAVK